MSATITINFAGGTATANNVVILLENATVSPDMQNGVIVAMASALTNISVLAGQVSIATAVNGKFQGSVEMAIAWEAGGIPAVVLNNLQPAVGSPATVTWPTAKGPQTQILTPGDPMSLSGIVAS